MIGTSILGVSNEWLRKNKILVSVLNNWEKKFLSSIYIRYKYKENRSFKQQRTFERIQYKSRLEKIPDKLLKEKPEIKINISHEKSVKIIEFVIKICGKAWDSYTQQQRDFLEDIMIQIQKPNAKLNGIQFQKIKEIIKTTKRRNSRYQTYVGRIINKKTTKKITNSDRDILKIIAVNDTRKASILCSLTVKFYSQTSYNIEILEDIWISIDQIYGKKRSELRERNN